MLPFQSRIFQEAYEITVVIEVFVTKAVGPHSRIASDYIDLYLGLDDPCLNYIIFKYLAAYLCNSNFSVCQYFDGREYHTLIDLISVKVGQIVPHGLLRDHS